MKEKYSTHDIKMDFDNLLRFREAENTPTPVIITPCLTWKYVTNKILNAFSKYKSNLLEEKKKMTVLKTQMNFFKRKEIPA